MDLKRWPSIRRAYDFVLPSYQVATTRFEAADTRINTTLTLAATLTLGAPVFLEKVVAAASLRAWQFRAALGCFIVMTALGLFGRLHGRLIVPDPMVHWKENLEDEELEFMKNSIFFAGKHFEANTRSIWQKNLISSLMVGLLAVEIVLIALLVAK
jgi:hypothetical protein